MMENIICPEPTALNRLGFVRYTCGWNKFHPYNMNRSYGTYLLEPLARCIKFVISYKS